MPSSRSGRRSAGLLVWRRTGAYPSPGSNEHQLGVQVLLAHPGGPLFVRRDDGVWTIPKGEYAPDEEPLAAAHREFAEEMGFAPPDAPAVPLGEARLRNGKVNIIWALEAGPGYEAGPVRSNLFAMQWPPRSGRVAEFPEVDRVAWYDLASAEGKVFPSQRTFLERLAAALRVSGGIGPGCDGG